MSTSSGRNIDDDIRLTIEKVLGRALKYAALYRQTGPVLPNPLSLPQVIAAFIRKKRSRTSNIAVAVSDNAVTLVDVVVRQAHWQVKRIIATYSREQIACRSLLDQPSSFALISGDETQLWALYRKWNTPSSVAIAKELCQPNQTWGT